MYLEIKKGMEFELFEEATINSIYVTIQKESEKNIKDLTAKKEEINPVMIGGFLLENVPLKKGGTANMWVEYNCYILPGIIDTGIHRALLFDEIPDEVLDRYNDMKNK